MLEKLLQNKKLLADVALIAAVLVIGLSVMLFISLTSEEGDMVVVSVDGKQVGEYPLNLDAVYYLNGGTNTLVIEDGYAYISEATCPDKFSKNGCVNTGKISKVGQSIVCLPHKLIVEIKGEGEAVDLI